MNRSLYRQHRPENFTEVIGQEHVTIPLSNALNKDKTNHAYLFSGPRGCGKTTSARILARCLNCHNGPTATPCNKCVSCQDLARNGSGSLDVIEIDAASNGGVDQARELRERALYAPVRDRYKIFIIDEAHMVTSAGFNALLKIVEEPPPHIKFVFATTEPEKVISTIRSRTHHYPFRLVSQAPLLKFLQQICEKEKIDTNNTVLTLIIKAATGSVRDSLSTLDQLLVGTTDNKITYDIAISLLGYTHVSLLNNIIVGFANKNANTVFTIINQIIQTGQDPRRFIEDLLERLRDLILVKALPNNAHNIITNISTEQLQTLRDQAATFNETELCTIAEITNETLNDMVGTITPRINLEILCAKILLPNHENTQRNIYSRLERLEKNTFPNKQTPPQATANPTQATTNSQPLAAPASPQTTTKQPFAPPPSTTTAAPPTQTLAAPTTPPTAAPTEQKDLKILQDSWDEILVSLSKIKRASWILVKQNATLTKFVEQTLTIAFQTKGLAETFSRNEHDKNLNKAIQQTLNINCAIQIIVNEKNHPPQPPPTTTTTPQTNPKQPKQTHNDNKWAKQTAPNAHIPWTPKQKTPNTHPNQTPTNQKNSNTQQNPNNTIQTVKNILGGKLIEEIPNKPKTS